MNRKTSLLAGVFAAVAGTLACSGANATLLNFDLNFNFGADGWELVQVAPGMNPENLVGYFKRPLEG